MKIVMLVEDGRLKIELHYVITVSISGVWIDLVYVDKKYFTILLL